jgi:UDP-N-acetylglucosamine:LPS N-acetylglucosamine transferase
MNALLGAFRRLGDGWRMLWSLPATQQKVLSESCSAYDHSKVRVETFVRQRAVLSHPAVRLFLTHGGQSSVNEALAAGLPMVCMPLFCDQYEIAEAVQRHRLGLVFHKDELIAGKDVHLSALLSRVAEVKRFRNTAQRYAHLMRLRQGCGRAAEVIESIIWAGADYQELWRGEPCAPLELEETSPCVAAGGA